jgi:hypothetical protein
MMVSYSIDLDTEGKISCAMGIKDNVVRYAVSGFFIVVFVIVAIFVFTRPRVEKLSLPVKSVLIESVRDAGSDLGKKPQKPQKPQKSSSSTPDAGVKSKSLKPDAGIKSKVLVSDSGAKPKG